MNPHNALGASLAAISRQGCAMSQTPLLPSKVRLRLAETVPMETDSFGGVVRGGGYPSRSPKCEAFAND